MRDQGVLGSGTGGELLVHFWPLHAYDRIKACMFKTMRMRVATSGGKGRYARAHMCPQLHMPPTSKHLGGTVMYATLQRAR